MGSPLGLLRVLAELMVSDGGAAHRTDLPVLGVYPSDPGLIDAACRLVRLLVRPETIDALAPLIEREILYRLLNGPHGPILRHLATAGSHLDQISRDIAAIRERFNSQIRIEEIAAQARMRPVIASYGRKGNYGSNTHRISEAVAPAARTPANAGRGSNSRHRRVRGRLLEPVAV